MSLQFSTYIVARDITNGAGITNPFTLKTPPAVGRGAGSAIRVQVVKSAARLQGGSD